LGKSIYIVGTKAEYDFDFYTFDQTVKHAKSLDVMMPIAFPTMLCSIILDQHPGILISSDVACKRESPLILHCRIFEGTHISDIVATSSQKTSHPMTRKEMVADLMGPMQVVSFGGKRENDSVIFRIISDHGKKFEDAKFSDFCSSEGLFLVYSTNNIAYKVFNSRTKVMMESINGVDDSLGDTVTNVDVDVGTSFQQTYVLDNLVDFNLYIELASSRTDDPQVNKGTSTRVQKNHPRELIIRSLNEGIITRSRNVISNLCYVFKVVNQDHIATEQQMENIYYKVLDDEQFEKSRGYLCSCCMRIYSNYSYGSVQTNTFHLL
jgi:hypothetical protein